MPRLIDEMCAEIVRGYDHIKERLYLLTELQEAAGYGYGVKAELLHRLLEKVDELEDEVNKLKKEKEDDRREQREPEQRQRDDSGKDGSSN